MNSGVYALDLSEILPMEYTGIHIDNENSGIYASKAGVRKRFDYKGNVLDEFVVFEVRDLTYVIGYDNDMDEYLNSVAKCKAYAIEYGKEGLMSADGKPLTAAIYSNINAISNNLYECNLASGSIILDANGKKVNK